MLVSRVELGDDSAARLMVTEAGGRSHSKDLAGLEAAYPRLRATFFRALGKLARQGFVVPPSEGLDLVHGFLAEGWAAVVSGFDPAKGNLEGYAYQAFVHYARPRIVRLNRLRTSLKDISELAETLEEPADQTARFESEHDIELFRRALASLPPLHQEILLAYLHASPASERSVARQFSMSRYQVRDALVDALGRVIVQLDKPEHLAERDWRVARALWHEGRTVREAALLMGLTEHQVREAHSRNAKWLAAVLGSVGTPREAGLRRQAMGKSADELLKTAMVSRGNRALLDEVRERAKELLEYLEAEDESALSEEDAQGLDPEWIAEIYAAIAEPEEPSAESLAVAEALLDFRSGREIALGEAFKQALIPGLPADMRRLDVRYRPLARVQEDQLAALLESPAVRAAMPEAKPFAEHGVTPLTVLHATDAIATLIDRLRRLERLDSNVAVVVGPEEGEGVLSQDMVVQEIENHAECSKDVAEVVLSWVIEVARYKPLLFPGFVARPNEAGVELRNDVTERELLQRWGWKDAPPPGQDPAFPPAVVGAELSSAHSLAVAEPLFQRVEEPYALLSATPSLPAGVEHVAYSAAGTGLVVGQAPTQAKWLVAALALSIAALGVYHLRPRPVGAIPIASIIVLPFEVDTRTADLGTGTQEVMSGGLSILPRLKVIPPTSESSTKLLGVSLDRLPRELNVEAVLTGQVRQRGDDIEIAAQLTNLRDNQRLWSKSDVKSYRELFAIQDALITGISETLRPNLDAKLKARLVKRPTEDPEAYLEYVKGRRQWATRTAEGFEAAIRHFQKAIDRDRNFAPAFAGLADSHALRGYYGYGPPADEYPMAKAFAEKALALDPQLAEAHASLALFRLFYEHNLPEAERELKRAIELDPSYATAHHWYANLLTAVYRHSEAERHARQALALDPLSRKMRLWFGVRLIDARQYDQAVQQFRELLAEDQGDGPARLSLGQALEQKGDLDGAIKELKAAKEVLKSDRANHLMVVAALGHAYAAAGQRDEALRELSEMRKISKEGFLPPVFQAVIHAALGDGNEAFRWLDKAYEEYDDLLFLRVDPLFDGLRSDPRFEGLAQRVGLPSRG